MNSQLVNIRKELPSDIQAIWQVNAEAFETEAEANLVNALRHSGCPYISLVAVEKDQIVGHIFFTPVQLSGGAPDLRIMGLAPMAVLKKKQKKGIGSRLVKAGLEHCIEQGYDAVVVLGHPDYYPKFGFVPSSQYNIKSEYEVPEEVFMILELVPESLKGQQGIIKYHDIFNGL